jgi:hypothetical protein
MFVLPFGQWLCAARRIIAHGCLDIVLPSPNTRSDSLPVSWQLCLLRAPSYKLQLSCSLFSPLEFWNQLRLTPAMSRDDEAKPVTVKIIETMFVEADTADDFKSVVQKLTGKDAVAQPEQTSRSTRAAPRTGSGKEGGSRGDREAGTSGTKQRNGQ